MLSIGLEFFLGLEGNLYKRPLGYEPVICCKPSLLKPKNAKEINGFQGVESAPFVLSMTEFPHKTRTANRAQLLCPFQQESP